MSIINEAYDEIEKVEELVGEDDDNLAELIYDMSQAMDDIRSVIHRAKAYKRELQRNG
tara:strand:- start:31244 stop:31417 length:174 start_codon:yes stop_codon:yes gene_type:complete